jgi:hypothetical protein
MLHKLLRDALASGASPSKAPSPALLREVWPTLLGEPLCHRTQPKCWRDKTLVIAVASDAWLKEMKRNQRQVHARIHRLLPWPVDALEFTVETLAPLPPAEPTATPAPDLPTPSPPDENLAEDLDRLDEPTRDLMLRIRAHIEFESEN